VIEWGKVPWTLWVLAALWVAELILFEAKLHGPVGPRVFYPVFVLAWLFFLLKGLRWVWIATLGFSVLGLLLLPISGSVTWHGVAEGAIGIGLLLMPSTRRYCSRVARTVEIR
jgi:hypothetical protein